MKQRSEFHEIRISLTPRVLDEVAHEWNAGDPLPSIREEGGLPVVHKDVLDSRRRRQLHAGTGLDRHPTMVVPYEPALNSPEEVKVVSQYDLFDESFLGNFSEVLDDSVFVLVIE